MASTSTLSIPKSFKYDVFLSFRGEDTRKNFVDHLYFALQQKNIHTYKDDERITKGKKISDDLIKSIEDSRFYIIVFSKNYASSSWCLEELVKIMECHKATEHTAYPVFYDVEPTEVRKQSGAVGEAFAKHAKEEAWGKWREALKEAADLAGWELKNTLNGHEAKFIQKIIEEVALELRSINFEVDEKLIGMETRINDVISRLETGVDDVQMIGIKGMGGAGKTTLARAIFDHISVQFDGKSFVENVREVSKASLSGLKELQYQVLYDVSKDRDITVSSVSDGKKMIKKMMCCRKVLVVLDDVDHLDQLEALAGNSNWFKPGSRIFITTRDEQVLITQRVNLIVDVNLLSDEEAISLFSRYAFGREMPIQGYEELSLQVVHYAAGLPLTIRVLGSLLCGKDDLEWEDAIDRLKTIPLRETIEKLELSYYGLEEDYKEIFLDVACLLKGWGKNDAIRALQSCGFHGRNGLRVLERKSLITVSKYEKLGMHDHIEEMGKNIVRRLHPDKPNKHSRLWIREEIEDILANDLGTLETKCIKLDAEVSNTDILMKGLVNMKELRYLDLHTTLPISEDDCYGSIWNFDEGSLHLPNALRFLRWNGYPFSSLPKTFQANNLAGVVMYLSNIVQLWDVGEQKVFCKLKFLEFSYSKLRTLDLRVTPNLEELHLKDCLNLEELHMPSESPKLRSFHLTYSKLRYLQLGITPNLETLRLNNCTDIVELQITTDGPKLVNVDLNMVMLRTLDLRLTPNLERLNLRNCYALEDVHMPSESLKLKHIDISHSKLTNLKLGITPNLETLRLHYCNYMDELHIHAIKLAKIDLNHVTLTTLDLGLTPKLERLCLKDCVLYKINAPVGCLKNLVCLELSGSGMFKSFSFDKELDSLKIGSFSELHLIANEPDNNWAEFKFSCYYKEDPASSFGNIERLISLSSYACINLYQFSDIICGLQCLRKLTFEGGIPELPTDLHRLAYLEELNLYYTEIKNLPDSICMLKNLISLELGSCLLLTKLPEDIGRLECLERLILRRCPNLRDLPNSICELKRLDLLDLSFCIQVEKLPEEIGRLKCLKDLILDGTGISHLPQSIFGLKGLRIFGLCYI